jgi:hypothetical protein
MLDSPMKSSIFDVQLRENWPNPTAGSTPDPDALPHLKRIVTSGISCIVGGDASPKPHRKSSEAKSRPGEV